MVHIILHTEKGRGWLTRRVLQSVTETQSHKHRVQLCACMNTTCIFTWRRPVHRASSRPSTLLDIYLFICGSQDLSLPSLLLNTAHAFLLFSCFLSDFVLFPFSQSVHIICVCVFGNPLFWPRNKKQLDGEFNESQTRTHVSNISSRDILCAETNVKYRSGK